MNKVVKVAFIVVSILIIMSVIVGVIDRRDQRKRERRAREEGKKIHKPFGPYEKYFKRPLDFFLSSLALIVLSPVIGIVALLIWIKLGSPILFIQKRPGRDETIFRLKKFRSMTDERDLLGELLPDEARMTLFGKILRSSSVDELPELFNIVRGEMSMIGPRPLVPQYLPYFTENEKHRHDVRPGLSGLAQINGRSSLSWDERFILDLEYVNRITFKTDIQIALKTIKKVIKEEDVVIRGTEGSILDFDVERQLNRKSKYASGE